jgi:hypothetical protein
MPLASGNFKIFTTLHKPATRKMATRVKLPSNARPVDVDPKERVVALCSFTIPDLRGEQPGFPERRLGPVSVCRLAKKVPGTRANPGGGYHNVDFRCYVA